VHFARKTCVVIGASGGIGRELVAELRRRGATVFPVVHSTSQLTKKKILSVDLGNPATIQRVLSIIGKRLVIPSGHD
jgi:short-subunit dehydrogenase